jgi:CTP:molybdopterin cytidylyltransferase MocA
MTESIVIMAAGASSRMKKSTIDNSLSTEKVKEANNKSKALIEFGKKKYSIYKLSVTKHYLFWF